MIFETSVVLDLVRGAYRARIADAEADLTAARTLRSRCFGLSGPDGDQFDDRALHILVERRDTAQLLCCFRVLLFENGTQITQSYSAQYYDLARLQRFAAPLAEIGRFCLAPDQSDPDILRLAWAAATYLVDGSGAELMFGCSSFLGTDVAQYGDAFALLNYRHLGPEALRPTRKASEYHGFADLFPTQPVADKPDLKRALGQMPSLLRSYLGMGGWVSDHVVVDRALNTLHVFTALEVGAMSDARKRALRALAQGPVSEHNHH